MSTTTVLQITYILAPGSGQKYIKHSLSDLCISTNTNLSFPPSSPPVGFNILTSRERRRGENHALQSYKVIEEMILVNIKQINKNISQPAITSHHCREYYDLTAGDKLARLSLNNFTKDQLCVEMVFKSHPANSGQVSRS